MIAPLVDRLPGMPAAQVLAHSVTRYDRARASRKGYNPWALGLYLEAADRAMALVGRGAPLRCALVCAYSGSLLDRVLRDLGCEPLADHEYRTIREARGGWELD